MYSDYKSPFAYLAFDPAFALGDRYRIRLRWIPFQLRIKGKGERSVYSEYKARYSYLDARRFAKPRGLVIRGPLKVYDTTPALIGPLFVATPALPAPKTTEPIKNRATISALQAFAAQIQAGDLLAAGRTLATLFDVEEPRAVACAATFAQRVRSEAAFYHKVMELRSELHSSNSQRALLLLLDCFGLSRGESAEILRNLQRRRRLGH